MERINFIPFLILNIEGLLWMVSWVYVQQYTSSLLIVYF